MSARTAPMKRGRPIGYRKPNARRHSIDVRLDDEEFAAAKRIARRWRTSISDAVRELIRAAGFTRAQRAAWHAKRR